MKSNDPQNFTTDKQSRKNAFGKIIPLALVALLFAGAIISIANDMYAFVKPSNDILFSVTDISSNFQLSRQLRKNNIIKNDIAFALYLKSKGVACDTCALSGEWLLNSSMSYREIYAEMF